MVSRNGVTGDIIKTTGKRKPLERYQPARVRRTRLQAALKSVVPDGIVQLNKRLSSLENIDSGVKLRFEDGTETTADVVVGGDGIRSVCPWKLPEIASEKLIRDGRSSENTSSRSIGFNLLVRRLTFLD